MSELLDPLAPGGDQQHDREEQGTTLTSLSPFGPREGAPRWPNASGGDRALQVSLPAQGV